MRKQRINYWNYEKFIKEMKLIFEQRHRNKFIHRIQVLVAQITYTTVQKYVAPTVPRFIIVYVRWVN